MTKIRRSLIDRSPSQPRTDWGDIEALAASIRARGLDKPLDIRVCGARYELVDGERRDRALDLLEIVELEPHQYRIVEVTDLDVALRHVSSNDGKPLTPMEEARAYKHLQEKHALNATDIADRVGRSVSHVRSRLLLAELHVGVQALLEAGRIKFASAARLAHTSHEIQEQAADAIARLHPIGSISTLDVVRILEAHTYRLASAPFDTCSDTLTTAGACTACEHNTSTQRDLFEEVDDGAACLRKECYASKVSANEALERDDAERAGIRIMDAEEAALTLDVGRVRPGAPWISVHEPIDDGVDLTWHDLELKLAEADKDGLGYDPKKLAMAFDGGRSVLLIERDYAEPFIRAEYPRRAAQLRGELDPDVAAAKAERKEAKAKEAAQAEVDAAVVTALVEAATKKTKPKTAEHVALLLLEIAGAAIAKSIAKRRELSLEDGHRSITPHEAVARLISTAEPEQLHAISLEIVVTAHLSDESLPSKALESLLRLYGVDPKEIAKELKREKRNVKTRKPKGGESAEAAS